MYAASYVPIFVLPYFLSTMFANVLLSASLHYNYYATPIGFDFCILLLTFNKPIIILIYSTINYATNTTQYTTK